MAQFEDMGLLCTNMTRDILQGAFTSICWDGLSDEDKPFRDTLMLVMTGTKSEATENAHESDED